jgi:hypothetical protein
VVPIAIAEISDGEEPTTMADPYPGRPVRGRPDRPSPLSPEQYRAQIARIRAALGVG